jgi:G3E family GTPase
VTQVNPNKHDNQEISLILVHGFLGSGKTTFLKNMLSQIMENTKLKVGLLMNDFGENSIDAMILNPQMKDNPIIEVNNGSIFCACRHNQFIDALIEISKYSIDFLFIEASGLSDPSPFLSDLAIVQKRVSNKYHHAIKICVIDAENVLDMREITPVIDRQIKYANIILLNKIDKLLAEQIPQKIEEIMNMIRQLNPQSLVIQTTQSNITLNQFFTLMNHKVEIVPKSQPSLDTEESSPLRITLKSLISVPMRRITTFFDNLVSDTLRIKGLLSIDQKWYYIDGINGHYSLEKLSEKNKDLKNHEMAQILIIFRLNSNLELVARVEAFWIEITRTQDP